MMKSNGKESRMKHFLFITLILLAAVSAHATDVGVSITVGQPGFYGHIDIGNLSHPGVIYPKPIIVRSAPAGVVVEQPIYLHVPPGHAKKWTKHCHEYKACGRPVYFVREQWYNDVYVPHYKARKSGVSQKKHQGPQPKHVRP